MLFYRTAYLNKRSLRGAEDFYWSLIHISFSRHTLRNQNVQNTSRPLFSLCDDLSW